MKKLLSFLITCVLAICLMLSLGSCIDTEVCKHEEVEEKNAREATETEVGYTGDTYCKLCGLRTAAGEEIPMLEHTLVKVERVEPTCLRRGAAEHYGCSNCKKLYADADGEVEVSSADLVLTAEHIYVDGRCDICGDIEREIPSVPGQEDKEESKPSEKEDPPAPDGEHDDPATDEGEGENPGAPEEDDDEVTDNENTENGGNETDEEENADPDEEIDTDPGVDDEEVDMGPIEEEEPDPEAPEDNEENTDDPEEDNGENNDPAPPANDQPPAPGGEIPTPPSSSEGKDYEDQEGVIGRPGILPVH